MFESFNSTLPAGKHQALELGLALTSESGDAISLFHDDPHVQEALSAKLRLHALWRRVACAAVVLLASRCYEARWLHNKYKVSRQVIKRPPVWVTVLSLE